MVFVIASTLALSKLDGKSPLAFICFASCGLTCGFKSSDQVQVKCPQSGVLLSAHFDHLLVVESFELRPRNAVNNQITQPSYPRNRFEFKTRRANLKCHSPIST